MEFDKCFTSPQCEKGNVFRYLDGTSYMYTYKALVHFQGEDEAADLAVTASTSISVITDCEMDLKVTHVELDNNSVLTKVSSNFFRDLTSYHLRFTFVDGVVERVCPSASESTWSLNFKRGILTLFQNSVGSGSVTLSAGDTGFVTETGVSGACTSRYNVESYTDGGHQCDKGTITREQVGACHAGAPPKTDLLLSSFLQDLPLIRVDRSCSSKIDGGVMRRTWCTEQHRAIWDFSDSIATIRSSLEYVGLEDKQETILNIDRFSNLTMELESHVANRAPSSWVSEAAVMIKKLAESVPGTDLAYSVFTKLRRFDSEQLHDLMLSISGEHWKLALLMILKMGTDASNEILRKMRLEYDVSSRELRDIVAHLTREYALRHSLALLDQVWDEPASGGMRKALRRYCRHNSSCSSDEDFRRARNNMVPYVECPHPYAYMGSLRALTQVGHLGSDWKRKKFSRCIEDNDPETQYRTLEALQNIECETFDFRKLLDAYENSKLSTYLDSIRYLTLVRCPVDGLKEFLLKKLSSDDVNEQTSFIWSHLSNSDELLAKEIVGDSGLRSKYVASALRFSRNFNEKFEFRNETYIVDMNLILSNENISPKYVSLRIAKPLQSYSVLNILIHQHERRCYVLDIELFDQFEFTKTFETHNPMEYFEYLVTPLEYVFYDIMRGVRLGHTVNELLLSYPTLVGMPLYLKSNLTTYSEPVRNVYSSAAHVNFQATINTPYTTIGRGMEMSTHLNTLASTFRTKKGNSESDHFILNLPFVRNSLMGFNMSRFNIQNGKSNHYLDVNDIAHSFCLPWFDSWIGITFCLTPYTSEQGAHSYSSTYSIDITRTPTVRGLDIRLTRARTESEQRIKILGDGVRDKEFYSRSYEFQDLHATELRVPGFDLEMKGTKLHNSKNDINMTGVMRIGGMKSNFTLEGTSTMPRHFDYFLSSPLWGSVEFHSSHKQFGENSVYTLEIPYDLKLWELSDTIKFEAENTMEDERYQVETQLDLPLIDHFNFETACYLEFRGSFFEGIMFGAEFDISVPLNALKAKSDFALSKSSLDHKTLVSFERDGVNTQMVSKDCIKIKDEDFEYTGDLLVNNLTVFDVRSSFSQPAVIPFKMSYQFRVPSRHHSIPPFEVKATSKLDLSRNTLQASVSGSHQGSRTNLELCFGREHVDEESDGRGRQAGLSVSCDGITALEVVTSWQFAPPSNFGVNASLRVPAAPIEALSLQVEKEGPHVALTLIEFGGDLEQTYALEGVLGD